MTAGIAKLPPKYRAGARKDLKAAYSRKTQVDVLRAQVQEDTEAGRPYDEAIYPAELDLAVKWGLITPKIAAKQKKWAETASDSELDDEVRYFRDHILGDYNKTINDIEGALEYYGWKPSSK
jgi:hypothetical protein